MEEYMQYDCAYLYYIHNNEAISGRKHAETGATLKFVYTKISFIALISNIYTTFILVYPILKTSLYPYFRDILTKNASVKNLIWAFNKKKLSFDAGFFTIFEANL